GRRETPYSARRAHRRTGAVGGLRPQKGAPRSAAAGALPVPRSVGL
ncbi:MAG: hypothetical protein AVDCRST_MAG02-415, partial [uncultured Rubrobacteraceae bacterium]